ncbi:MAG TPA: hypothetical protein VG269_22910 [Tepidisphaeraceae bacterium]|jgi:hypothetical protein|nr:hypothetical protein [Tepidisphaeraceae bacterium]
MNRRFVKIYLALLLLVIALVAWNWDAFSRYQNVDLQAMGSFPLSAEAGTLNDVPARFRELDGRRVRVVGFMYDSSGKDNSTRFQFVLPPGNSRTPPRVQERIFASMPAGRSAQFVNGLAELYGTLHVKVKHVPSDDIITSLYELDVESIGPLREGPDWPGWVQRLVFVVFVVWGFRGALAMLRRYPRRKPVGVCPMCGYDLRATRDRCPECVTATGDTRAKSPSAPSCP